MKNAFTLAEVLITLTVIGIITAVIVPVAIHNKPDENIMKFKKAHNTLYQVVSTLVNSDKYYMDGDLGILAGGSYAKKSSFCLNFADVVSSKKTNCDYTTTNTDGFYSSCALPKDKGDCITLDYENIKNSVDSSCKTAQEKYVNKGDLGIKTIDDVYFYEENQNNFFGCIYKENCAADRGTNWKKFEGVNLFGSADFDLITFDTGVKHYRRYRTFCIDIDGINKGEDPFGYGIRVDGKIIVGKRATDWLEKSIQGE